MLHPRKLVSPGWPLLAFLSAATLTACGTGSQHTESAAAARRACPATVAGDLVRVVKHVYVDGVESERTVLARRYIETSAPLRTALERDDAIGVRAAAHALVASGHMTNLRVIARGRTLADVGGPAVAPLSGEIVGAAHEPLASYVTSVWSDEGLLAESDGLTQARIALRVGERSVGGSQPLPRGKLPTRGELSIGGVAWQYASFPARAYPSGAVRIYVLRPLSAVLSLCGRTREQTTVNTLGSIAKLIYSGEIGPRTRPQVRRVEHDRALLRAVVAGAIIPIRIADADLLSQHIVRLRVLAADGSLLADIGGPYVLAPVPGTLRSGGRRIGSFLLSIQDDEGYLRLTRRLAGLRVLMYMGATLVKNSLGPNPGGVPDSGPYTYRRARYQVVTLNAQAFPAGPLTIRVLVPIPYR